MKKNYFILFVFLFFNFILVRSQDNILNTQLLETNFGGDGYPSNIQLFSNNKLIFNSKYGVNIKNSENESSRLLIKISSEYKNFVNEDNVYTYNASRAMAITIIDNIAYFFVKKLNKLAFFKTDGTNEGTKLIKQFPLESQSVDVNIDKIYKINNNFMFSIFLSDYFYRTEFWTSDGTPDGTNIIFSKNSLSGSVVTKYTASDFVNLDGIFYFRYFDENNRSTIWKTDGSVTGTKILIDPTVDNYQILSGLFIINNQLLFIKFKDNKKYFTQYDTSTNLFLDKVDITSIIPSYNNYISIVKNNNNLFFIDKNNKLWKSDATQVGTIQLNSNYYVDSYEKILNFKDRIYFSGYNSDITKDGIFFYDGNSIQFLPDLYPETQGLSIEAISNGGNLILIGINSSQDYFVFNNVAMKKIENLTFNYSSGFYPEIIDFSDKEFLINAGNKKYGQEIFKYDFSTNENSIYDNSISTNGSSFLSPQKLNDKLFYFGTDEFGNGPIVSDGTKAGTHKINKNVTVELSSGGSYVTKLPNVNINDKIYFPCRNGNSGTELCVSDGTEVGTYIVKDINPNGDGVLYNEDAPFMKLSNDKFLFKGNDGSGNKLWVSDGTKEGTKSISNILPYYYSYKGSATINNKTFFTALDNQNKSFLMQSDGTSAGTTPFYYFPVAGGACSIIGQTENSFFINVKNGNNTTFKNELWISDGTPEGTKLLKSFSETHYSSPGINENVALNNNKLYFFASAEISNNPTKHAAYVSDGTANGTFKISNFEFENGANPIYPYNSAHVVACGTDVYYVNIPNYTGTSSILNYKNNTLEILYTNPQSDATTFAPNNEKCIDGKLFFLNKLYSNNNLWISNGTVNGTKMLNIIANNVPTTDPINSLGSEGNKLFIHANFKDSDGFDRFGQELYSTDILPLLDTNETNNILASEEILVYPNPTNGILEIASVKNASLLQLEIFDNNGRLLLTKYQNNQKNIIVNIENFSIGTYFLKIKTNSKILMRKVIKK